MTECWLQTTSGLPIAVTAARLVPNATNTVPVMGAIDVTPGTYDVKLECGYDDNQWSEPQISVLAVPR